MEVKINEDNCHNPTSGYSLYSGPELSLTQDALVKAREGPTRNESEMETSDSPALQPQSFIPCYSVLIVDQAVEVCAEGGRVQNDEKGKKYVKKTMVMWDKHPDVDGGWAWVVLISCFCIFLITSGMLTVNGVYYVQMLEEYKYSRSYTAWMGSLFSAFYMLVGPISAIFIKRFGCRPSILVGSILMCIGYFLSAFTTSLEALFVTYGVIVSSGMNFCYSGQIIALTQYFNRKHSIATSLSMIGIGLGMILMSILIEYNIQIHGWKGSFIWDAGISLHILVFGSLIFPLQPLKDEVREDKDDKMNTGQQPSGTTTTSGNILVYPFKKSLNDRSFSCLRLSLGTSYLSHLLLSLSEQCDNHRFNPSRRSRQRRFCFRGSCFAVGDIRSDGASVCTLDGPSDVGHCDLPRHTHLTTDSGHTSSVHTFSGCDAQSREQCVCQLMVERKKLDTHSFRNRYRSFKKKHSNHPLMEWRFWLLDLAIFFSMSTLLIFIIYKDFAIYKGLGEYYATALSGLGIGDVCGRLTVGLLLSIHRIDQRLDSLLVYALAMFFCGIDILCHMFISTSTQFIILAWLFGVMYGSLNILIAVVPSRVFGREKLTTVFGHILFLGGIGALLGAPLAGLIVDKTGNYDGLIWFSTASLFLATTLLCACSIVNRNMKLREQQTQEG